VVLVVVVDPEEMSVAPVAVVAVVAVEESSWPPVFCQLRTQQLSRFMSMVAMAATEARVLLALVVAAVAVAT
jgi:hypothetical protein